MKSVAIGAHLRRDDVEPLAECVPVGDLFLSAVAIADDQPIGDRELLLRVAGVRAKLLEQATFIAIRYGFTFTTDADAHAKCAVHLLRWRRALEEHRDRFEMTLKIAASSPRPRPDRREFTSGADYLRALHEATNAADIDPDFRAAIERLIVPHATKHRWTARDEKSIELAALIPRTSLETVRAAGEELRRGAPHVPFLMSGPWPLEVFADDDRE